MSEPLAQPVESPSPPAFGETLGRLLLALGLIAFAFCFWLAYVEEAGEWSSHLLRVVPRLSIFVLSALVALILIGARERTGVLFGLGATLVCGATLLLGFDFVVPMPRGFAPGESSVLLHWLGYADELRVLAEPLLLFLVLLGQVLGAVLLGLVLGRQIDTGDALVALILTASAGDMWLNTFRVPDAPGMPALQVLRICWPPAAGEVSAGPLLSDLVVLAAALECAGRLRLHGLALAGGAVSGFLAASFLALEPWPGLGGMSLLVWGCGMLIACWPDLQATPRGLRRALLLGGLLLSLLLGMALLQRSVSPRLERPTHPLRYHGAA